MTIPYNYILNTMENNSQLGIYVNGNFETSYDFQNEVITLSERKNSTTVALSEFSESLSQMQKWIALIRKYLIIKNKKIGQLDTRIKKSDDEIQAKMEINSKTLSKIHYKPKSLEITFFPREKMHINLKEFETWYQFMTQVLQLTKEYGE